MTDSIEELATKLEAVIAQLAGDPEIPRTDSDQLIIYCGGTSTPEDSSFTFGDLRAAALKLRECREALEPFAEAGKVKLCGGDFWTDDKSINNTDVAFYIKFGDLRRAAKALEAK